MNNLKRQFLMLRDKVAKASSVLLSKDNLRVKNVSTDKIVSTFLDNLPPDVRKMHDCPHCMYTLRVIGHVVYQPDKYTDEWESIWHIIELPINLEWVYGKSFTAIRELIDEAEILPHEWKGCLLPGPSTKGRHVIKGAHSTYAQTRYKVNERNIEATKIACSDEDVNIGDVVEVPHLYIPNKITGVPVQAGCPRLHVTDDRYTRHPINGKPIESTNDILVWCMNNSEIAVPIKSIIAVIYNDDLHDSYMQLCTMNDRTKRNWDILTEAILSTESYVQIVAEPYNASSSEEVLILVDVLELIGTVVDIWYPEHKSSLINFYHRIKKFKVEYLLEDFINGVKTGKHPMRREYQYVIPKWTGDKTPYIKCQLLAYADNANKKGESLSGKKGEPNNGIE